MSAIYNPAEKVVKLGRKLRLDSYENVQAQLKPDEILFRVVRYYKGESNWLTAFRVEHWQDFNAYAAGNERYFDLVGFYAVKESDVLQHLTLRQWNLRRISAR